MTTFAESWWFFQQINELMEILLQCQLNQAVELVFALLVISPHKDKKEDQAENSSHTQFPKPAAHEAFFKGKSSVTVCRGQAKRRSWKPNHQILNLPPKIFARKIMAYDVFLSVKKESWFGRNSPVRIMIYCCDPPGDEAQSSRSTLALVLQTLWSHQ